MATRLESGQAQLRSASGVPMERVVPQQVEFVGPRAQARTADIMAQIIDRMTTGIMQYGGQVRQREAVQFVIDQPPTPEQMLAAKEGDISTLIPAGDFTKFDKAVRKARAFQLSEKFGAESRNDIVTIAERAANGQITPDAAKTEITNRIRGYTSALAQADGEAALRYEATATAEGHVAYKTALDAAAKKTKEQQKIEFLADTDNKIKIYRAGVLINPALAPQYEALFRSSILKAATLHGPEVYKEYQAFVDKEFAAARKDVLLQHLSDERYLSNPRETFKQLNSGVFDAMPGQDALFKNQEVKTLLGWMRLNDADNLRDIIKEFNGMAAQRKQGIDLALVDAEQQGKQLLRDIYKVGTPIATMNQKLRELQNLPVDPSVIKQARDFIKEQSAPAEGGTNLLVYDRYKRQAINGALNIEQLNRDPSISKSDKKALVGLNANPSPALTNGFKNIEFSGGQTSENLPPNFDTAEGKKIASDAIATKKQALLNYAQTPDANGRYPSGADVTKKANELAAGVKVLLGRSFVKEAQSQKSTAEMAIAELSGVDLGNDAAVQAAIAKATARGVQTNDVNMAKNAINKYKEAMKNAPKEQK
jgi:hypothetical protein